MAKKKHDDAADSHTDSAPERTVTERPKPEPKPEKPSRLHGKPVRSPGPPAIAQVQLRVFVRAFGVKWDQVAGFMHYAQSNKLGPMSMADWRAEYERFLSSPA